MGFICDCCGLCCMNLNMSKLYDDLDRGDGVCKYLDINSKLCTIYDIRPEKCNVDKFYKRYFQCKMNIEEYYKLNYDTCNFFKQKKEEGF